MTVIELCRMSVTALAEAIRSGQVSSREAAETYQRRMGHLQPSGKCRDPVNC